MSECWHEYVRLDNPTIVQCTKCGEFRDGSYYNGYLACRAVAAEKISTLEKALEWCKPNINAPSCLHIFGGPTVDSFCRCAFCGAEESLGNACAWNECVRRAAERNAAKDATIAAKDAVIKSLDGHLVTDHGFCRICGKRVWGIGNNHADECPVPGVVACMVAANCEALAAARKEKETT